MLRLENFVIAFLDFKTYKKFSEFLARETEVWIAEMLEHMIHLNEDKFFDHVRREIKNGKT